MIVDTRGVILIANASVEEFEDAPAELIEQPVETLLPERFRTIHAKHRTLTGMGGINQSLGAAGGP